VVFGHVLSGKEIVSQIENIPTDRDTNRPKTEVVIANCGELVRVVKKKKKEATCKYISLAKKTTSDG
jgi:peptidyl-prolyl isomerase G (cyclophilin G)